MGLWIAGEGLMLAIAVGGLVARYVPPHRCWWLQLLAVGLPLLVVPLGVAALFALRASWTSVAIVNAVAMLWIGSRLVHIDLGSPAEGAPTLTVVSYNAGGFRESSAALRELHAEFGRVQPDLVAWQEVAVRRLKRPTGAVAAPRNLQSTAALLGHRVPQLDLGPIGRGRNGPVSTSLKAVAESVVLHPESGSAGYSGSITRTQLVWQGRPFALYNVHLHSFNERPRPSSWTAWLRPVVLRDALAAMKVAFLAQEREAVLLRATLDEEHLPYLVCGDLNNTSSNWAHAHIAEGLTDAFAAAGSGVGATYHPQRALVRIDYVLASPAWEVTNASVLPVRASDHLPVLASLRWRTGGG